MKLTLAFLIGTILVMAVGIATKINKLSYNDGVLDGMRLAHALERGTITKEEAIRRINEGNLKLGTP